MYIVRLVLAVLPSSHDYRVWSMTYNLIILAVIVAAFAIEYNAPSNLNLKLQTLTESIAVAVYEKSKQKKKTHRGRHREKHNCIRNGFDLFR
jgi:hypothetical protein